MVIGIDINIIKALYILLFISIYLIEIGNNSFKLIRSMIEAHNDKLIQIHLFMFLTLK